MRGKLKSVRGLAVISALVAAGCGGGSGGGFAGFPFLPGGGNGGPSVPDGGGNPGPSGPQEPAAMVPTALSCGVPEVSPEGTKAATICPAVVEAAAKIQEDPRVQQLAAELEKPEEVKRRFNDFLEIVRIAAPSRFEYFRAAEMERRLVEDYGFSRSEIRTTPQGYLPGSDVQIVDGLPVYNVCVEIKGSYAGTPGAKSYKGQYPKVLVEGHLDVVFPEKPPVQNDRFLPIKLQSYSKPVVTVPEELDAITDELAFDAKGRVIEDANYVKASQQFASSTAARQGGGMRIYVPGYADATPEAVSTMHMARMLKKLNIKPVYDVWFCGTAGEEGKGNLAGMKQLYGYDQGSGKGTNPLNFVTNFGLDMGMWAVNFTGSYRFEMKYSVPAGGGGPGKPSALEAAAATVARIADLNTVSDPGGAGGPRTTYTVGTVECAAPRANSTVVPSCTIQVDMRSARLPTLNEIRAQIEPNFKKGVEQEHARYGVAGNSADAVQLEMLWFGDRPPHERTNLSDPAIQSVWQASEVTGVGKRTDAGSGANSLNDNIPAAMGIPTVNLTGAAPATNSGIHTFWEWGTRGTTEAEVGRMRRVLMTTLIAAGFNAADGTVVPPAAGPVGARTAESK